MIKHALPISAITLCLAVFTASFTKPSTPSVGAQGFAVVELFTSEGCSSCPPADDALTELVERAQRDDLPIFALSFHVDYWNRLGWKDPFSAAAWSERQRIYSTRTDDNVYTPQCIVNGTNSFVGSRSGELNTEVNKAIAGTTVNGIEVDAHRTDAVITVTYAVAGPVAETELVVALVESGLSSQVRSGENGGRLLTHVNVVRELKRVAISDAARGGTATLSANALKDAGNAQVILFVQERGQGAVTGAASRKLM
ncbi:MAG: DUF1223 domain-containing protein [Flavobacteriales bacterium]